MAGEQVLRLSGRQPQSVDYVAAAAGKRGDIVDVNGKAAFLLDDVSANGRVAAAIGCDLVTVPQPTTAQAWKAGDSVYIDKDGGISGRTSIARHKLGCVHEDVADTATRVPIVWQPDYGHFYLEMHASTTPAFRLPKPANPARPNLGSNNGTSQYYDNLTVSGTVNLKGIRPNVPVFIDYDGFVYWVMNKNVTAEIIIMFLFWENTPSKVATLEHKHITDTRKGSEYSEALRGFSNQFVIGVGDFVPRARLAAGAVTEVTQADFDNGIPVRMGFRIRALDPANPHNSDPKVLEENVTLNPLIGEELGCVIRQEGAPVK